MTIAGASVVAVASSPEAAPLSWARELVVRFTCVGPSEIGETKGLAWRRHCCIVAAIFADVLWSVFVVVK